MAYTNVHRMFVQGMMSRSVATEEVALQMLHFILCSVYPKKYQENEDVEQHIDLLKSTVKLINEYLSPLGMNIKFAICELTSENYYVLIRTVSNSVAKSAMKYNAKELELFQKMVEEIACAEGGWVPSVYCLNLTLMSSMSRVETQSAIIMFVADHWFIMQEGNIALGVRTIAELGTSLQAIYKDIIKCCPLCKVTVFLGVNCAACLTKVHSHCLNKFRTNGNSIKCPACHVQLPQFEQLSLEDTQQDCPEEMQVEDSNVTRTRKCKSKRTSN